MTGHGRHAVIGSVEDVFDSCTNSTLETNRVRLIITPTYKPQNITTVCTCCIRNGRTNGE